MQALTYIPHSSSMPFVLPTPTIVRAQPLVAPTLLPDATTLDQFSPGSTCPRHPAGSTTTGAPRGLQVTAAIPTPIFDESPPRTSQLIPRVSDDRLPCATKQQRELWARTMLPIDVQLALNNPFGKDNICQSFYSDVLFRHTLVFLFKSGFLGSAATKRLLKSYPLARRLDRLMRQYQDADFRPLRNGWSASDYGPKEFLQKLSTLW